MIHFDKIKTWHGDKSCVYIPNYIFNDLRIGIKEMTGKVNSSTVGFALSYIVVNAFLYKYALYVDIDSGESVSVDDIKKALGYSPNNKSLNDIIKKGGVLDSIGITVDSTNYPIFCKDTDITYNKIAVKEHIYISDLDKEDELYLKIRNSVSNRYKVKIPSFMLDNKDGYNSTNLDVENTFKITIDEAIAIILDNNWSCIDFMIYSFIKSHCAGNGDRGFKMSSSFIQEGVGASKQVVLKSVKKLEEEGLIKVTRNGWSASKNIKKTNTYSV